MKDKFNKVLSLIFVTSLVIFISMTIYFKNNIANINLLDNNIFTILFYTTICILALTGLMLILTGLCYVRDYLSAKQNAVFKKKQLIVGSIVICLVFVVLIINSWNNKSNSQSKKDDISQIKNDNSENSQQSNDSISKPNNSAITDTSSSTFTQTETVKQPNNSGKLTSEDGNLELENNYSSNGEICGIIKNLSSYSYRYVEVDINLYDSNGNQVESTLSNINNLDGNTNWNFKAPVINQNRVSSYKIVSIKGNR